MNGDSILKRKALILGFWSAIAVAIFTIAFVIALPLTFNFSKWSGIEAYAQSFKTLQMLTVLPSILLASSFVIFTVSIHYYADEDKKIWSHLAIVFGLIYATISTMNYLIQIITVMPSITNMQLSGLEIFVAGYPNSIFFALMASYFFMCISSLFIAFVFNKEKTQRGIRILFIGTGLSGPLCLLGVFIETSITMPLSAVLWFICLSIGSIKIAIYFKELLKSKQGNLK